MIDLTENETSLRLSALHAATSLVPYMPAPDAQALIQSSDAIYAWLAGPQVQE